MSTTSGHVLDNPARGALTGPHAHFAERRGRVLRYPVDVTPWLALPDEPDADDWADAAALSGPGTRSRSSLPGQSPGRLGDHVPTSRACRCGRRAGRGAGSGSGPPRPGRRTEMLDLVERTSPARFCPAPSNSAPTWHTPERCLVAMAARTAAPARLDESAPSAPTPPPAARGLASRLILAVAHGIRERRRAPFLTRSRQHPRHPPVRVLGFRLRLSRRSSSASSGGT